MGHALRLTRAVGAFFAVTAIALSLGAGCPPFPLSFDPGLSSGLGVAIAADSQAEVGSTVSAAASIWGTTGPVNCQWSITSPGSMVAGESDVIANFTSSAPGTALLVVTVTDPATGAVATDAKEIAFQEATTPPAPPAALTVNAGQDQTVQVGHAILLAGTASGGVPSYVYEWRQASGPSQNVSPQFAFASAEITVIGTTPGTTIFTLFVTDSQGTIASKSVTVTVTAGPG